MSEDPGTLDIPILPSIGVGPGRRRLDVLVAVSGLLLTAPLLLVLWLAVRLTSRGPGFFRQQRVGQGGRPFTMYKLRTMRGTAVGLDITGPQDPRVTRLGALLRATSVDELPQLWNVLRGDMTLVGPRPESLRLAARYAPGCQWIFAFRPGLTGPSQVRMRDAQLFRSRGPFDEAEYLEHVVPARAVLDALYLADPSLAATLRILASTIHALNGFSR